MFLGGPWTCGRRPYVSVALAAPGTWPSQRSCVRVTWKNGLISRSTAMSWWDGHRRGSHRASKSLKASRSWKLKASFWGIRVFESQRAGHKSTCLCLLGYFNSIPKCLELALPAALAYPLGCVELVLANEPVKMFRNSPLGGFRSNFSIPLPELIYWLQHSWPAISTLQAPAPTTASRAFGTQGRWEVGAKMDVLRSWISRIFLDFWE